MYIYCKIYITYYTFLARNMQPLFYELYFSTNLYEYLCLAAKYELLISYRIQKYENLSTLCLFLRVCKNPFPILAQRFRSAIFVLSAKRSHQGQFWVGYFVMGAKSFKRFCQFSLHFFQRIMIFPFFKLQLLNSTLAFIWTCKS